jgi:small subunit ribosomal protein S6
MNKYEILYILTTGLGDEATDAQIEKYNKLIEASGGAVEKTDKWGVKKLAYPIDYKTEGYYVLVNFTAPSTLPLEIERQMKISDEIIRSIIIKKD